MLKAEHLYKSFGKEAVLKDLNMEVKKGSVYGLAGINGAGKSTLLRIIAGVYKADQGTVTLEGKDTFLASEIRKSISFVADEPYCPSGATIQSMRLFYECMYDFDGALFDSYCRTFDLPPSKPMSAFSKGMKRRTALLFALCTHPELILLDEAYDGLEPLAKLQFRRILAERMEEEGISAIISSHSLRELEDICDAFGILENGAICTGGDLLEMKEKLHRFQAAFAEEMDKDSFKDLDILSFSREGRVIQMVVRGDVEEVRASLMKHHPLLLDVLPVSLEELFVSELESRGIYHE